MKCITLKCDARSRFLENDGSEVDSWVPKVVVICQNDTGT